MEIGPDFSYHDTRDMEQQFSRLSSARKTHWVEFILHKFVVFNGKWNCLPFLPNAQRMQSFFCIYIPSTKCIVHMYGVDLCCNPASKAKRETCTLAHWQLRPSVRCSVDADECSTIVIYKSFIFSAGILAVLLSACVLFKTAAFVRGI